jgi:hypothetical protein
MADVDSSQVMSLARDLAGAPRRVETQADRVMKKGALEVKRGMQRVFSGHRYAGAVPGSLEFQKVGPQTYDIGELDSAGPQWGLAAILAYGTSNNAPVVDHTKPLAREALVVAERLGDAGQDAVLGGAR